jgi:hypothetical protein
MNDKNLREALSLITASFTGELIAPVRFNQWDFDRIKSAIAKDQEEERLFCKEVVHAKIKGKGVEGAEFGA